jgi:hypothetical protein
MSGTRRTIINGSFREHLLQGGRTLTLITETQHVTRRRIYAIRTDDDVLSVLNRLKAEKFMGRVKFNVGVGGTIMDVELEESAKLKPGNDLTPP